MSRQIIVIAHDIRSTHNIGALLRTCEGLGVEKVYITGYSPYPAHQKDDRLPYLSAKITKQINKTALGAQDSQDWEQITDVHTVLTRLKSDGYQIAALEQTDSSVSLPDFKPPHKLALLLGREVEGIDTDLLDQADVNLEIPMSGKKESFNVVQAAAMALYYCRFV